MFKKFISGLIIGAGFAISFCLIYTAWWYWVLPNTIEKFNKESREKYESSYGESNEVVDEPPKLDKSIGFLGSSGMTKSEFNRSKTKRLSSGDGKIIGLVKANGEPVNGLRLKLALNGEVYSQWGVSDQDGLYEISVPYGEYRIDGYQIDHKTANKHLPGKIDHPRRHFSSKFSTVNVTEDSDGKGLNFVFVDPVIINGPFGEISLSKDVIASWEAYTNATNYYIEVLQFDDDDGFEQPVYMLGWSDRIHVYDTSVNLTKYNVQFEEGKYYRLEISAHNKEGKILSNTPNQHDRRDFKIISNNN